MTVKNNIKAWSYSRISNYLTCPLQFAHKNIIKEIPQPAYYASERGTAIHKKAEHFVKGNITGMPDELKPFAKELRELKRLQAGTEVDLTFTQGWKPTHAKDWGGAWCRVALDSLVIQDELATNIDYKTGKIYDSHELQGLIDAAATFAHFPEVEQVDVEFWYFDLMEKENVMAETYTRGQYARLQKYLIKLTKPMFSDTKFKPKKNAYCYNCYVNAECPIYKR